MRKRKETYGSCIREVETHNTVFKSDICFVIKLALRAFAAPQVLRQFLPMAKNANAV